MQLINGDMWSIYDQSDLFFITTNSTITKEGDLIMGRGIAGEAATRYPAIPTVWGKHLIQMGRPREYNLLVSSRWQEGKKLAAFQTKYEPAQPSLPGLISRSVIMLKVLAERHPGKRFDLNFPGIGYGRLKEKEVLPIIQCLPDNVYVWKKLQ